MESVMAKLRLGAIESDKPIRITIELPAAVHRDLLHYSEVHARETGQPALEPTKLVAPMLARFMATDRGFAKSKRNTRSLQGPVG
jgi:hypothetical protein